MALRLLVLDDDDGIRTSLALAMEDEGYEVSSAATAEEALTLVSSLVEDGQQPDVMVVDLMLGGIDGFSFIRRVRPLSGAPVIVVSARRDKTDVIAALEVGADDYVTKPFDVDELAARLKALRRRFSGTTPTPTTVVLDSGEGGWPPVELDVDGGQVRRGGDLVHLTVTEFRLLCELAAAPGRVLSRGVLLERVWDRGFFGDERIVDVHVRRLRTKVERDPSSPRLVATVRGLGYRLDLR
ncbi:response regulator transcription factor [Kineococcus rhizosphaerae]|uniref:response regulator transcription factor n=1 Tax=Kineococcus rhizosphaerae TaxID=559628 RepID=UPI000D0725AE|nr:response regulator transcription factor [Kineococcus rhizosphaerae]